MKTKIIFLFILFFSTSLDVFSQQTKRQYGTLEGKVLDEDNSPLIGANVRIENTLIGSATNVKGNFKIIRVPSGKHIIKVTMVGYATETLPVEIFDGQVTRVEIKMKQTMIQTGEVFVSASKYEQKLNEIPVSISTVTAREIMNRSVKRFDDVLRYVPGINLTSDQISIRGSSGYTRGAGSRVLLLFDGIPLYTGDTGDIIWQLIPLYEIERVEVVKSSGSALYGSQAIGGVINVISKDFTGTPLTYFRTMGGFYDEPYHKVWKWSDRKRYFNKISVSHSRKVGDLGLTLSLSRFEDDSYKMNSFTKRYSLFLKSKYNINPTNNISILFNGTTYHSGSFLYWSSSRNALVPQESQIGQTVSTKRFHTHLNYQRLFANNMILDFRNSWFHNDWWDNTESKNTAKSNMLRTELMMTYFLDNKHRFISGLELSYSNVTSNIFSNPEAYGLAIYGQDEMNLLNDLRLTTGLRIDYQKVEEKLSELNFNPKVALNFKLSDKTYLRSSAGRGYRAPTPSEMFSSTYVSGVKVSPNPELKSESSWSFEFGANHTLTDFMRLDVALFNTELYNFIEPSIDPSTVEIKFRNVTRARITGYEVITNFDLLDRHLTVNAGYTYLWARDLKNKIFLKYRPKHLFLLNTLYKYKLAQINLDFRYWNRIESIDEELITYGIVKDGDLRERVLLTDLTLMLDLISLKLPIRIYFGVNNLFNYNYIEMVGNLGPIRSFNITIEGIM